MIVCKFQKKGASVYMPHLDTMRTLVMAMRRQGLRIAYSEGFNPHPRLFLSPPPPIGLASDAEYFAVESDEDAQAFMEKLNQSLPDGIRILKAAYAPLNPNFAAIAAVCDYTIVLDRAVEFPDLDAVLKSESYPIAFVQKGEQVTKDVRGFIYDLKKQSDTTYRYTLAYGNRNLRADRLTDHFLKAANASGTHFTATKTRMYTAAMQELDAVCFESS